MKNYIVPKNICFSFPPSDTETSWDAGGLKLELITPMKRWSISYEGTMIHQTTGKAHQVNLKVRNDMAEPTL